MLWLKIEGGSVGKMDEGSGYRQTEVLWVKIVGGYGLRKMGVLWVRWMKVLVTDRRRFYGL